MRLIESGQGGDAHSLLDEGDVGFPMQIIDGGRCSWQGQTIRFSVFLPSVNLGCSSGTIVQLVLGRHWVQRLAAITR